VQVGWDWRMVPGFRRDQAREVYARIETEKKGPRRRRKIRAREKRDARPSSDSKAERRNAEGGGSRWARVIWAWSRSRDPGGKSWFKLDGFEECLYMGYRRGEKQRN